MTIQEHIDECLEDGFEIVQRGRVLIQYVDGPKKLPFNERVEGFNIHLMGSYPPPYYRSVYDNRLFDDEHEWVHLRREKRHV